MRWQFPSPDCQALHGASDSCGCQRQTSVQNGSWGASRLLWHLVVQYSEGLAWSCLCIYPFKNSSPSLRGDRPQHCWICWHCCKCQPEQVLKTDFAVLGDENGGIMNQRNHRAGRDQQRPSNLFLDKTVPGSSLSHVPLKIPCAFTTSMASGYHSQAGACLHPLGSVETSDPL